MVRDDTVATYTRPEVEALIDAAATLYPARSQWWSAPIVTAWTTGMRTGAIDPLRWADPARNQATWRVRPRHAVTAPSVSSVARASPQRAVKR